MKIIGYEYCTLCNTPYKKNGKDHLFCSTKCENIFKDAQEKAEQVKKEEEQKDEQSE